MFWIQRSTFREGTHILINVSSQMIIQLSKLDPSISPYFPGIQPNMTSIEEADNKTQFDVQWSGRGKLDDIMKYIEWQGNSTLTCWNSPQANSIDGTEGYQFHPVSHFFSSYVDVTLASAAG